MGARSSSSCATQGVAPDPVPVRRRRGRAAARDRATCSTPSRATASCSPPATSRATRSSRVVDAAVEAGLETIVVTHPEFPAQRIASADQRGWPTSGALLERCFTTPYTGKVHVGATCSRRSRAVAPSARSWSTDLGQVFNPPVEDGLALMADRFLAAGFSEEEIRTMAVDQHAGRLAGAGCPDAMSRRVQVIGAHSADFVWRAGGAVAVAVEAGGDGRGRSRCPTASAASPASCGSRRARRSRTSSASATREAEAAAAGARRDLPLPGPRRLPAADRRRRAAADRRRDPRLRARRAHHPHRHATRSTPITRSPRPRSTARAAWPPAPACRARSTTITPPQLFLFEPHQPELCNFTPTTFVDITSVIERKQAAMARDEGPEYLQTYYAQRAEQRGNHARRASGDASGALRRGLPARDPAGGGASCEPHDHAELARLGSRDRLRGRRARAGSSTRDAPPGRARARAPAGRRASRAARRTTT